MARLDLKSHFTWMAIAGVMVAANGVIQLLAGNVTLGVSSLVVGLLCVVLGLIRPRLLSRRKDEPAKGTKSRRWIAPLGWLLLIAAVFAGLYAGLPEFYRDSVEVPTALRMITWGLLAAGAALLVLSLRSERATRPLTGRLIAAALLCGLGVLVAATPVTRWAVAQVWRAVNEPEIRLVYGFDVSSGVTASESDLTATVLRLSAYLESLGQFHPSEQLDDGGIALLVASPDPYLIDELRGLVSAGYVGFHLLHPESDELVAAGVATPEGYRALAAASGPMMVEHAAVLTGMSINQVWIHQDATGQTAIDVMFDDNGRRRLAEITAANIGRRLAVVHGGKVAMAPQIQEAITGGRVTISGDIADQEIWPLGRALFLGGLPSPLILLSEESVGP